MKIRTGLLAAASVVVMTGSAMAADPVIVAPPAPPPPPAPEFNWSGPYVGAYAGYWVGDGAMVGGLVGYNYQINNFVVGVDVSAGVYDFAGGPYFEAFAILRAGFAFDRVLVYAGVGPGWDSGLVAYATTGLEFAVTDSIAIRGEAAFWQPFTGGGFGGRVGVTYRFDGL